MKNIRFLLSIALIVVLLSALLYKSSINYAQYSQTEFLLDTECMIDAYGKHVKQGVELAFKEIEEVHNLTNYYSDSSDVYKINSAKAGDAVKVDDRTFEIIGIALEVGEKSGGKFDITIAPVKDLWNFKAESPRVPSQDEIREKLKLVDCRKLLIDEENKTVTKSEDGIKIDLGGIAKGYAGDRALKVLQDFGIESGIIDLGGNVLTFGDNKKSQDTSWRVGIQEPFAPTGEYYTVINIKNKAIVTSGTYERYFKIGDRVYHHIIDPATGYPADMPYNSVTIVHASSVIADALSTACFVLGEEDGEKLAKSYGAEIQYK